MSDVLENIRESARMRRAEARAKRFPPPDPTIVARPWTSEEHYSAVHGRGRNLFFDESEEDEEVDTRLPSERLGCKY